MKSLLVILGIVLAPLVASAQPPGAPGDGAAPAPGSAASAGAAAPAAGTAAAADPRLNSGAPPSEITTPADVEPLTATAPGAPAPTAPTRSPQELRQICADAMNADPTFAEAIATTVSEQTVQQHRDAAKAIAKNERHVILAYGAMWVFAAGFLMFLWRRQQRLKAEIAQLRRDLDAATR